MRGNGDIEVRAEKGPFGRPQVDIYIVEHCKEGVLAVGEVVMTKQEHHGAMISPAVRLRPNEAQALMDDLWACGIRPSEGTGSAGALKATQYHLEDMRRLVFDDGKLKVEHDKRGLEHD